MADKIIHPSAWLDSYASDGTTITLPIASITGLNVSDAHTTTGDIREITKYLIQTLLTHQDAVTEGEKIESMTITKNQSIAVAGKVRTKYSVVFSCDIEETAVEDADTY